MEIQRKCLAANLPADLEQYPAAAITQGYWVEKGTAADAEVRVRRMATACFLTIKHGQRLCRTEVELPLASADFDTLWPMTEGRRRMKTRYRLAHRAWVIELEVFSGAHAGLQTAEVEFPSVEANAGGAPQGFFGREVTEHPAYRNASLARNGLPSAEGSCSDAPKG